MPSRKMIDVDVLIRTVENLNELLASELPQSAKASICSSIEGILFAVDCYEGFNTLFWHTLDGYAKWVANNMPDFPEKNTFLIGPNAVKADAENIANKVPNFQSKFVSALEGEYSRIYYLGKLRRLKKSEK